MDENPIPVTTAGHAREGLMSSSKTLRNETLSIFYLENEFFVFAPSHCIEAYIRFTRTIDSLPLRAKAKKRIRMPIILDETPHWNNLIRWLRFFYISGYPALVGPSEIREHKRYKVDSLCVSGLFATVGAMRALPWIKVMGVLQQHRVILGYIDKRWFEDKRLGTT